MLVFSLPLKSASERVGVWRKLRRFGALPMRSAGYILPKTAQNEERFQWLAAEIRKARGHASVIHVSNIDDHPPAELVRLFKEARRSEYEQLAKAIQKIGRKSTSTKQISSLRRQLAEIAERDSFGSPLKSRIEMQLTRFDAPNLVTKKGTRVTQRRHTNRIWVTRKRPGIDRVSSAWLIRRFVDPNAKFVFADNPEAHPEAIPFDMFTKAGFGHRGSNCTFETLVEEFHVDDRRVISIAQAIHDADLADGKFGRVEAIGIDRILIGWAQEGISDEELLRRGMDLIEGLYHSV
jgi:hypothetical protein